MDINEEIRFRVVDELFTDLSPAGPEMTGDMKNTDEVDSKRSPYTITVSPVIVFIICIGNSMICSDISKLIYVIWDNFEISQVVFMSNIKYKSCYIALFVYTTTHKRFVIFTCRYFKLSWNTTALSLQSNCRNFSCSSLNSGTPLISHQRVKNFGCFNGVAVLQAQGQISWLKGCNHKYTLHHIHTSCTTVLFNKQLECRYRVQ